MLSEYSNINNFELDGKISTAFVLNNVYYYKSCKTVLNSMKKTLFALILNTLLVTLQATLFGYAHCVRETECDLMNAI